MTLTSNDLAIIIRILQTVLQSSTWTSAGGKNPTDNFIKELRGIENPDAAADESIAEGISGEAGEGLGSIGTGGVSDIGTALAAARGGNLGALTSRAAGLAGIASPVAVAFLIQPVTEQVIAELQRPGGFFDKRVRINAQEEAFAELDRQTRQNTRIGDRQVIIQQFDGFRNFDGIASTNTSRLIRENADRVLDIGLFDRAGGVR